MNAQTKRLLPSAIIGLVLAAIGIIDVASIVISASQFREAENILAFLLIVAGGGIPLAGYTIVKKGRSRLGPEEAKIADLDDRQIRLLGIAKTYPKIRIGDIATKIGMLERDAENLLIGLVARGQIKGRVDPGTKEFISGMIDSGTDTVPLMKLVQCPYCNAPLNTSVVKGASIKCTACGNLITPG